MSRTKEQWLTLFDTYQHSGELFTHFCKARRMCPSHFRKKLREYGVNNPTGSVDQHQKWVKLSTQDKPMTSASTPQVKKEFIQIRTSKVSIDVPIMVSAQLMGEIIKRLAS